MGGAAGAGWGQMPGVAPVVDACEGVDDVGAAPLRRLTRSEYARSVESVFGVSGDEAAASLAIDERVDGVFASNLSSSVAPVQVRQYLDAAEAVAARVDLDALAGCDRAARGDEACARAFVEQVGRRAYRRRLDDAEVERLFGAYRMLAAEGHDDALRVIVQAMLQSPSFLYHLEPSEVTATATQVARLTSYALASRLSFFLWGGPPDDALLDAAESGELESSQGVVRQAERLLEDPRAAFAIESFHAQWLGLGRLDGASRDPQLFPEWNPELVQALRDEVAAFSDHVIRAQRGDLHELLTASYTFPSGPGLELRDDAEVGSDGKLELPAGRAAGLLTQPAFLAAHAHVDQSSPILRGRAVRERFLCQPLPDPPPDVAAVAPDLSPGLTTRERYAKHRTAGTACFGCHRLIDDLGFALEHYDALGRYRETEQDKPIDATGELIETDVDGPIDGARMLAEHLGQSVQVEQCYARQWLRFALGRPEGDADRCSLERLGRTLAEAGSIRDLLLAITTSDAFVSQKVEP